MKKLASTLPNMIMSLGLIAVLAGGMLGGVYMVTKEPIEIQVQQQQVAAIRDVAPDFNNNPEDDRKEFVIGGNTFTVYPAVLDGKLNGAAVKGVSMNGFAGEIVVMCGFEKDGTVKDYKVLQQAETPGLGTKMQEWFRDPVGARSVLGKNPSTTSFYVTKDAASHGQIDGITAATISSRAFLETMRNAYDAYKSYEKLDNKQ